MEGWIKIHRQIKDHWIWDNPIYLKAWLGILLTVNHDDNKVLIEGELIDCNRGQSLISLAGWVKCFGKNWTMQRVRTFFELLKQDEMITTEGLRKTTRLTVCNYDNYQFEQQAKNKQRTSKQQGDNKEITTNKNEKNEKNEKNVIPPTLEMVKKYCHERNNKIDPQRFIDNNSAKGWMIGKNKMIDWQAAIRTWEKNNFNKTTSETVIFGDKKIDYTTVK